MTQEADPKLDELREEYDRHRANCLRSGGTVRYKLAEAAWRETVAYIERRERARWEAAVRAQVDEDVRRLVEASRGVKTIYDAQGRYPTIRSLNALAAALEPSKGTTVEEGRSDA